LQFAPPALLRGLPVLIVDDNATNRHIVDEWLRGYAMEPTVAGDGASAMAALWQGVAQGRPYPLVVLDGRMPDIDGLAVAAKIREQAELAATRIVLLTSGDRPGDLALVERWNPISLSFRGPTSKALAAKRIQSTCLLRSEAYSRISWRGSYLSRLRVEIVG
jgi:CheY-like chemotaxis protein